MTGIRSLLLSFLCLVFLSGSSLAQRSTYHCRKTSQVLEFIKQHHYAPIAVDEQFSDDVNTAFITTLDPLGFFFTREDAAYMKSLCPDISNLGCKSNKNFMDHIAAFYRICLHESEAMMDAVFNSPLDFQREDTLVFPEHGKTCYPNNTLEIQQNWERYLKLQLLRHYFSTFQPEKPTFEKDQSDFMRNLDTLRADILQREYCKINHLLNHPGGFNEYLFGLYLNTLTSSFDPHTNYFSKNDKELFESSISRNKISFGADLSQNDNGEIVISRLVPGGPAWRSGELNPGDVLLNMRFPKRELIDLLCSDLREIEDLIYNAGTDKLEITVRSVLGQVKTVELKMEALMAAENSIYSFILEGEKRIGYVSLPGFYTEPDQKDPMGCASDLAGEIIRLQADGIDGLILDVRNNGGGSVTEAVDLAGIFIDSGPLCLFRTPVEKPSLIKDLKKGAVYDGPLMVMINGYSASASEIMAGILQDYNRALILGTSSFGKASGQIIAPLGEPGDGKQGFYYFDETPTDFIKITTTRYYRLNGTSYQASGIIPDIPLPAHAGFSRIRESAYPSALKNDSLTIHITFEPFPPLPLELLRSSSAERLRLNSSFILFNALNDSIKPLYTGEFRIPLGFHSFKSEYLRNKGIFDQIDNLKATPGSSFKVVNHAYDRAVLPSDEYRKEIHNEIIRNLTEDHSLEEAYFVMNDFIELSNKNQSSR